MARPWSVRCGMLPPTTTTDVMTAVPAPGAASSWRRISTGDNTVAVAERAALGTTARLAVWPPESLGAALGAVDGVRSALDRQASRFREDSEIAWIHRSAGDADCFLFAFDCDFER